jgi:hypothetical protein
MVILIAAPLWAADAPATTAPTEDEKQGESLTEVSGEHEERLEAGVFVRKKMNGEGK